MGCKNSTVLSDPHAALPVEVAECIASFLIGIEIAKYARASPLLFAIFNSPDVWRANASVTEALGSEDVEPEPLALKVPASCCREKALYLKQRALLFRGRMRKTIKLGLYCDFVDLPHERLRRWNRFTIRMTFSVLPTHPGAKTCESGVLLGFHTMKNFSQAWNSPQTGTFEIATQRPYQHLALVSIDSQGRLRLPVGSYHMTPKAVVADLAFHRWYNLVVVVEGEELSAYLNGGRCYHITIPNGLQCQACSTVQVGNGYGPDPDRTEYAQRLRGMDWYPFHGLVTDVQAWDGVVSEDAAQNIARGLPAPTPPAFTLADVPSEERRAQSVVSSWSCEVYADYLPC